MDEVHTDIRDCDILWLAHVYHAQGRYADAKVSQD